MNLYEKTDAEFLTEANKLKKAAVSSAAIWRKEAEEDFNFTAGYQWAADDIEKLRREQRPVITFNRCNVIVSAILGMEANQRQELKLNPRGNDNVMISAGMNSVAAWARDYADISAEEAAIFEDMLTCGMGWSETRMDYDQDLDGRIVQEQVSPFEAWWDPIARKRNLVDARYLGRSKRLTKEDIKDRFPDAVFVESDESFDLLDSENTLSLVETVEPYNTPNIEQNDTQIDRGVPVHEITWYELIPVYRIMDPGTGKIVEVSDEEYGKAKKMLDFMGAETIKQKKRKYYRAFFTDKTLLEKKEAPLQSNFALQCVTGKRDHVNKQWFGIVRLIKDPQRWANKFLSTFLDIIDSNAKGGIMAEVGAVEDVRQFEEKWAKADSIAWMKAGAIAGNKISPKPVAQYPQSIDKLMTLSIQSIHDVSGVNLELLGAVDRGEVGMVVDSRKKSAYTILAPYFDALKNFRMTNGLVLMECIKRYVPLERVAEILDTPYKPVAQIIKNIDLQSLNIIVSEAPQSDNNRIVVWQFMSQILPQIAPLGIPIPPSIVDYFPLPPDINAEWKKMWQQAEQMKQQNPMQQIGQAQAQVNVQKTQAETALKQAQAQKTTIEAGMPPAQPAPPPQHEMAQMQVDMAHKMADAQLKHAQAKKADSEAMQNEMEVVQGKNTFGQT